LISGNVAASRHRKSTLPFPRQAKGCGRHHAAIGRGCEGLSGLARGDVATAPRLPIACAVSDPMYRARHRRRD
jgi:hypothetical protein